MSSARFRAAESWSLHGRNALEKRANASAPSGQGPNRPAASSAPDSPASTNSAPQASAKARGAPARRNAGRSAQRSATAGNGRGERGRGPKSWTGARPSPCFRYQEQRRDRHRPPGEFGSGGRCTGHDIGTSPCATEMTGRVACATASPRRSHPFPGLRRMPVGGGAGSIDSRGRQLAFQRASHRSSSGRRGREESGLSA